MKYLIRSVKYFLAFCVLYVAIVYLSIMTTKGMDISAWEYIVAAFSTTRGKMLGLAVVVLSALYPRMGFMTRRVECDMQQERDYLIQMFAVAGFSLKEESEGRMVFRADNILSRLVMLFEDDITVEQYGQWIDITGIRRGVAKVVYRMGR
ncbi:MAG: hypothetical protein IKV12_05230 [Alistipes sp.]|nr:hypothetical protein [Alistipes sp.]